MSNRFVLAMAAVGALALASGMARAQDPDVLSSVGSALFEGAPTYRGVRLSSMRYAVAALISPDAPDGQVVVTLIGRAAGNLPRVMTLTGTVESSQFLPSGTVRLTGTATVDPGDGSPPLAGIPYELRTTPDTNGQGTVVLTVENVPLTAAVTILGGVQSSSCIAPEFGGTLTFTNQTTLAWPPTPYEALLYRGSFQPGAWTFNHTCYQGTTDASVPSLGTGLYYLLAVRSPCGEGSHGVSTPGTEIPNLAPCP
jgi:hypothetical protein